MEPFWHLSYKDRIGSSGVGEWGTRRAGLRVIEECGSELRKELPLCGYATGMEVRTEVWPDSLMKACRSYALGCLSA